MIEHRDLQLLKALKRQSLRIASTLGLQESVARSSWRRQRLLILCYHGVARFDEHHWRPALYVRPSFLRDRLTAIADSPFVVLPLDEGLRRMREGNLPPRSVAITFDDGEAGFYSHAFPIIKQHQLPVTVYLSTYYVENRRPVITVALSYLLWKADDNTNIKHLPYLGPLDFTLSDLETRRRALRDIRYGIECLNLNSNQENEVLAELCRSLNLDWEQFRSERRLELMSPAEVTQLSQEGVDFQLHTHRHRVPDERDLFYREIADNREALRQYTGENARHFCYPSGVYNEQVVRWLSEMDVESATTGNPGLAAPDSNPLLLPRIVDVPTLDATEFRAWLSGLAQWLPKRTTTPHLLAKVQGIQNTLGDAMTA